MLNLQKPIRRSANFPSRRVEQDGVVVATERGEAILLNGVGYRLWEWIDDKRSAEELVTLITEHYQVSRQQALADLEVYLMRLRALEMIGWDA